jgi:hypothetical protein
MCHEPFTSSARAEDRSNPFRLPDPRTDSPAWAVFGVLAILLCLGLASEDPGILIVLLILLVPVLIRTVVVTIRSREAGAPLTVGQTLLAFFTSIGIVAVVGVAAGVAFFISCFAVCLGGLALTNQGFRGMDGVLISAWTIGGLLGLVVFILLMRALWPRKG